MKQGSASLEEIAHPGAFDEIIDVRSPAEFAEDHIPGAINCPVLDNEQRIEVGTLYKQASPFEAKKIGAAYVTVVISGDVAAVSAAIEAGKQAVGSLGKVIAAHVIARPHDELIALLPK